MAITKKNAQERTYLMIDNLYCRMKDAVNTALDSGKIDLDDETDDFSLPQKLMVAIMENEMGQYTPPTFWTATAKRLWRKTVNKIKLSLTLR